MCVFLLSLKEKLLFLPVIKCISILKKMYIRRKRGKRRIYSISIFVMTETETTRPKKKKAPREIRRRRALSKQIVPEHYELLESINRRKYQYKYITRQGQIFSRFTTGLSAKKQKRFAKAIKTARIMGFLPFKQSISWYRDRWLTLKRRRARRRAKQKKLRRGRRQVEKD